MKKKLLAFGTFVLLLTSCSTSQTALGDLRDLSNRIEADGASYGINDWKQTAEKYYKIDKKIANYAAEGKYSNEESQEIGRLQSKCIKGFTKGVAENVGTKALNIVNFIKGIIDGAKE